MKRILFLMITILTFSAVAKTATYTWTSLNASQKDYGNGMRWASGGCLNGVPYVFSNDYNFTSSSKVFVEDLTSYMPLPAYALTKLNDFSVAGAGNKLYILGGDSGIGKNPVQNTIYEFTPAGGFQKLTQTIQARKGATAVVIGSKIYLIGGFDQYNNQQNTVLIYDAANNFAASSGAPVPVSINAMTAGAAAKKAANGKNYIYVSSSSSKEIYRYDVSANSWKKLSGTFLTNFNVIRSAVDSLNQIHLIAMQFPQKQIYDWVINDNDGAANTYTLGGVSVVAANRSRSNFEMVNCGGTAYIYGGTGYISNTTMTRYVDKLVVK